MTMSSEMKSVNPEKVQPSTYTGMSVIPSFWREEQTNLYVGAENDYPYFLTISGTLEETDSPYMAFYLNNGINGITKPDGSNLKGLIEILCDSGTQPQDIKFYQQKNT